MIISRVILGTNEVTLYVRFLRLPNADIGLSFLFVKLKKRRLLLLAPSVLHTRRWVMFFFNLSAGRGRSRLVPTRFA